MGWLNINKLDEVIKKLDKLPRKIGFKKDYSRRTGEWSYWNWDVWDRLYFINRIIENSVGKKWDDVYSHILTKTKEKYKHLLHESYLIPKRGYYDSENIPRDITYNSIFWKNEIFIDEEGILRKAINGFDKSKIFYTYNKPKKKNKISFLDKKIYYWSLECEYVYFPENIGYSKYNKKVKITDFYSCIINKDHIKNYNKFTWTYLTTDKDSKTTLFKNKGTFENMIAWLEKNNKTYLIYHKDCLFYSENFNKTMMK